MNPLEIQVTTPGAPQSSGELRDVARANDQLAESTRGAGKAFAEANPEIDAFGRKGGEGRRAVMELDMVMRGGKESVFGLAGAWRSLNIAMAENPFTAILAIIFAVVIPAFEALKKSWEDASKTADEMQKKNAETFKTAKEDAEKLNDVDLEPFREKLRGIEAEARSIIGQVDAVDAAFEKMMHAAAARDIARIKADPNLTQEEKTARIGEIEQQTRSDDRARSINKLDSADSANAAAVAQLRAQLAAAQASLDQVKSAALGVALKPGVIQGRLSGVQKRLEDAKERAYVSDLSDDDAAAADRASGDTGVTALVAEVRRLQTALESAEADAQDPQKLGAMAGLQTVRQKAVDEAQKALAAANARAADEKAKNNAVRFGITGAGEYEDQTKAIEEQEAENKDRLVDQEKADKRALADAEAQSRGAASGIYRDLAGVKGGGDLVARAAEATQKLGQGGTSGDLLALVNVLGTLLAQLEKTHNASAPAIQLLIRQIQAQELKQRQFETDLQGLKASAAFGGG